MPVNIPTDAKRSIPPMNIRNRETMIDRTTAVIVIPQLKSFV